MNPDVIKKQRESAAVEMERWAQSCNSDSYYRAHLFMTMVRQLRAMEGTLSAMGEQAFLTESLFNELRDNLHAS